MRRRPPRISTAALAAPAVVSWLLGCATPPGDDSPSASTSPAELAPYVEHLAEVEPPVDYVLGLFEDHDIVVLCERWHPEMTQYELFFDLLADPRGAEITHLFTELGSRSLQGRLDELMRTEGLDEEGVARRLLPIYRDLGHHPGWDNTNFFEFLSRLYFLRRSRPEGQRMRLRFSGLALAWPSMTKEAYAAFTAEALPERDRRMARLVIEGFPEAEADGPAKALVIMNYRHAFNAFTFDDGSKGDNVGRYLFEAFGDRVANVMLSSVALLPGTTDSEVVYEPIQKGRWDAAFRFAGVEEAGFDFAGSPFGRDHFDYFTFRPHSVTYQDVFTGFVFYRPLAEHYLLSGIPGYYDGFVDEFRRRLAIVGYEMTEQELQEAMATSRTPLRETYEDLERLEAMIASWLEEAG